MHALTTRDLKQLGLLVALYANNYNESYPPAYYNKDLYSWDTKQDGSPGIMYEGAGKYSAIQQCPSFHGTSNTPNDPYTGYNYNTSYIGSDTAKPARLPDVRDPSRTAVFGDGETRIGGVPGANKYMRAPSDNAVVPAKEGAQGYRHQNKTNISWADGHASSVADKYNGGTVTYTGTGFISNDDSLYDLN